MWNISASTARIFYLDSCLGDQTESYYSLNLQSLEMEDNDWKEDDLKVLKVEYISNRWLDLPQIKKIHTLNLDSCFIGGNSEEIIVEISSVALLSPVCWCSLVEAYGALISMETCLVFCCCLQP